WLWEWGNGSQRHTKCLVDGRGFDKTWLGGCISLELVPVVFHYIDIEVFTRLKAEGFIFPSNIKYLHWSGPSEEDEDEDEYEYEDEEDSD
ncbi:hypothetical protein Tco_0915243, partial [Tanacetum coccineum]